MGSKASFSHSLLVLFLSSIVLLHLCYPSPVLARRHRHRRPRPCKSFSVYLHDILYDGTNLHNFTSAVVGSPVWASPMKGDVKNNYFGDVMVFNDPLTLDERLHSSPVGHAQGLFLFDNMKKFTAWMSFTLVLHSAHHKGTINIMGANPVVEKRRYLSVVGGSGDFFMTRGMAIISSRSVQEDLQYFRIRLDIELYECY